MRGYPSEARTRRLPGSTRAPLRRAVFHTGECLPLRRSEPIGSGRRCLPDQHAAPTTGACHLWCRFEDPEPIGAGRAVSRDRRGAPTGRFFLVCSSRVGTHRRRTRLSPGISAPLRRVFFQLVSVRPWNCRKPGRRRLPDATRPLRRRVSALWQMPAWNPIWKRGRGCLPGCTARAAIRRRMLRWNLVPAWKAKPSEAGQRCRHGCQQQRAPAPTGYLRWPVPEAWDPSGESGRAAVSRDAARRFPTGDLRWSVPEAWSPSEAGAVCLPDATAALDRGVLRWPTPKLVIFKPGTLMLRAYSMAPAAQGDDVAIAA